MSDDMRTIYHMPDYVLWVNKDYRVWHTDKGLWDAECKEMKPNYPVPAIPLVVDYWPDTIGIFAFNKDYDCGDVVASFIKR